MQQKHSWVRTVYLYLFSLVGLTLVIVGVVRLMNLGLKVYIFKEADKLDNYQSPPPFPPYGVLESRPVSKEAGPEDVKISQKVEALTPAEKTSLNQWEIDYNNWKDTQGKIDYVKARRQAEGSSALAMILVGLPLYLYHWMIIKRDRKES